MYTLRQVILCLCVQGLNDMFFRKGNAVNIYRAIRIRHDGHSFLPAEKDLYAAQRPFGNGVGILLCRGQGKHGDLLISQSDYIFLVVGKTRGGFVIPQRPVALLRLHVGGVVGRVFVLGILTARALIDGCPVRLSEHLVKNLLAFHRGLCRFIIRQPTGQEIDRPV